MQKLFLIPLLFLFSCHTIYKPSISVVPDIRQKGEAEISGGVTYYHKEDSFFGTLIPGIFGYTSHSPFQHWLAGISGNYLQHRYNERGNFNKFSELSPFVGYYNTLPNDSLIAFQLTGGTGFGQGRVYSMYSGLSSEYQNGNILKGNYINGYLQPSIQLYSRRKILVNTFSLRINMIHYYHAVMQRIDWNTNIINGVNGGYKRYELLFEPDYTFRVNAKHVSFYTQLLISLESNIQQVSFENHILNLFFGITLNLNKNWNLHKKPVTY